jgi:hypothetical protein
MDADLDLLLIAVYCTVDDFLPERARNARRRISDAEVITLSIAQAMMGIPSDARLLRAARRQLGHLFPYLPERTWSLLWALYWARAGPGSPERICSHALRSHS